MGSKSYVDYEKIYKYLEERKGKVITASGLAFGIGVDRIYGATMLKLVRQDLIAPCEQKGYYIVL